LFTSTYAYIVALVAHGAEKRCDEIFGVKGEEIFDKKSGISKGSRYKVDLESEEKPYPISTELFTRFYYGCGDPYEFSLIEVPLDTKFIGWDLD
jgi:hypothetical protein